MKVFISYNRESQEAATKLANDIEELGHTAWMDQKLSGAQTWWNEILKTIRACDVFVFVMDPASLESEACKREWGYAADLGKAILPVLSSDGVKLHLLPRALIEVQYVDYRNRDANAALKLARAFATLPDPQPLPDPLPEPPEVPVSYLGGLAEMVGRDTLSYADQGTLVFDLRRSLRDAEAREDAIELLKRLRSRKDVFAAIAEEIDAILPRRSPPPPPGLRGQKPAPATRDIAEQNAPAPAVPEVAQGVSKPTSEPENPVAVPQRLLTRLLIAMGIGVLIGVVVGWLAAIGLMSSLNYSVAREMGGDEVPGFIALLTVAGMSTHLALGMAIKRLLGSTGIWTWSTVAGWIVAAILTWFLACTQLFGDLTAMILLPILGGALAGYGQAKALHTAIGNSRIWWAASPATWLGAVILASLISFVGGMELLFALMLFGSICWIAVLPIALRIVIRRSFSTTGSN